MVHRWARALLAIAGAAFGLYLAGQALEVAQSLFEVSLTRPEATVALAVGVLAGALAGFVLAPALTDGAAAATRWLEGRLLRLPGVDIIFGAAGAILGLIAALLLGPALSRIPTVGDLLPTAASVLLAYLGWRVFVRKRADLQRLLGLGRAARRIGGPGVRRLRRLAAGTPHAAPAEEADPEAVDAAAAAQREARPVWKVLDTSSIIDGRITDLCRTGFLEGPLLVPQFVLDELRHIADSGDPLKRNRGRRGLDVLAAIQREQRVRVVIDDRDVLPGAEVDSKLLRLAREMDARVITTDYNLNKVAGVQGVLVLNVNELANALKPVYLPGEQTVVRVIREGKESGQGVGYLDDGTMIVVEGGRAYVGEDVAVEVTSTLQTAAGRMIFARLRTAPALQRVAGR